MDVHVRRLREKIPGLAPSIVTVKSLGYRLARESPELMRGPARRGSPPPRSPPPRPRSLAVFLLVGPARARARPSRTAARRCWRKRRSWRGFVEAPLAVGRGTPRRSTRIVDAAAREAGGRRVTIVAPDGRVLADSAASGAELAGAREPRRPARGARARCATAAGPPSAAARPSATTCSTSRCRSAGAAGCSGSRASRRSDRARGAGRGAAAPGDRLRRWPSPSLVTAVLALALSASLAGPLREIMDSARRFAAGDLAARIARRPRRRAGRAGADPEPTPRTSSRPGSPRSRGTARARTPSCRRWRTGCWRWTTAATVLLANESLCRRPRLRDPARPPLPGGGAPARGGRAGGGGAAHGRAAGGGGATSTTCGASTPWPAGPFPGVEGAPHGAVVTFHDVTERRRVDAGPPRLRGQRVARAAHAAHLDPRVRGGAGGRRAGRAGDTRSASSARSAPTPTAWPRWSRTCSSCRGSSRASAPPRWETRGAHGDRRGRGRLVRRPGRAQADRRSPPATRGARTSRPTPSACAASSRTSWRTRSSTRPRAARWRSTRAGRGRRRVHRGPGRRARHRGRAPAPDLRALLPRGQGAQPRHRRDRASASRSSATSRRASTPRSRSRASRARARASRSPVPRRPPERISRVIASTSSHGKVIRVTPRARHGAGRRRVEEVRRHHQGAPAEGGASSTRSWPGTPPTSRRR